jgi:hypothetical protein
MVVTGRSYIQVPATSSIMHVPLNQLPAPTVDTNWLELPTGDVAASLAIPVIMFNTTGLAGMVQRGLFPIGYLWYCAEAARLLRESRFTSIMEDQQSSLSSPESEISA